MIKYCVCISDFIYFDPCPGLCSKYGTIKQQMGKKKKNEELLKKNQSFKNTACMLLIRTVYT